MIYDVATDSYMLKDWALKLAVGRVLEMGCGSGFASLALKKIGKKVLCVDINPEAVEYCSEKGLDTLESDLFSSVVGKFDTILFNAPYLPADSREDAECALCVSGGKKGNELIIRFLREAVEHLSGSIILVFSSLTPSFDDELEELGYSWECLEEKGEFMEKIICWRVWKR